MKAVIFDMDGLLIDSEPMWRASEISIFAKVGVHLTEEMCMQTMGQRLDQVIQHWFARSPWSGSSQQQIADEILAEMERNIAERAELMQGAREAIAAAHSKGLLTAVASSSPQRLIDAMVRRFALADSFTTLHSAQFEERGKPDPAVYLTAAKKLGVAAEDCLAVEDSVAGVTAAKAAGMLCCAVPDPRADLSLFMDADIVIDSLKSFPRSLERIC